MTERPPGLSRRRFLTVAGAAASVGACSASPAPLGDVVAVKASSLANPSLEPVGTQAVCIGRDSKGIYAMTLVCTHQSCDIGSSGGTVGPKGLRCPCHGSTFDANGNVTGGPAAAPLQHFAVTADASGNLTIHGDQTVSADIRLTGV